MFSLCMTPVVRRRGIGVGYWWRLPGCLPGCCHCIVAACNRDTDSSQAVNLGGTSCVATKHTHQHITSTGVCVWGGGRAVQILPWPHISTPPIPAGAADCCCCCCYLSHIPYQPNIKARLTAATAAIIAATLMLLL
jgi:hypothetical protein